MARAIKVTEETLPYILAEAKKFNFNLDYVEDEFLYVPAEERTQYYIVTDGRAEWNNIVFTMFGVEWFRDTFEFVDDETGAEFQEIVRR